MSFLSKYYKPWSLRWIIQRFILVIRQGTFSQISFKTLIIDYKSYKKVGKSLKKQSSAGHSDINSGNDPSFLDNISSNEKSERIVTCPHLDPSFLSALNKYFDHIYIVNLARRADRRREMVQKLTKLKIKAEFFPAEDGTSEENFREFSDYFNTPIDPENAHELEIKLKRKAIFSPGAWGTLKTYKNILTEAGNKGFDKILCLEDDAIFAKYFEESFNQAITIIPENWKLLYLGASQHSWAENIDLIIPADKFDENTPVKYYLPLNTDGAFAIGIRNRAFSYLISEINKMNCAFDSGALRSAAKAFKGGCFVVTPNLVIADVRDSDIRIGRKQSDFAEIVRWDLKLYDL
jgi:GR25 family glycosyltransferase involved in LPS biosynthesis